MASGGDSGPESGGPNSNDKLQVVSLQTTRVRLQERQDQRCVAGVPIDKPCLTVVDNFPIENQLQQFRTIIAVGRRQTIVDRGFVVPSNPVSAAAAFEIRLRWHGNLSPAEMRQLTLSSEYG